MSAWNGSHSSQGENQVLGVIGNSTSVINSESFRAWALEHNSHTGTCLFQVLYELWDEFNYDQFAVMLRLYSSEEKGRGRAEPRKLLSGRYEIIRKLGTGGFGEVFLVWSWETTTLYALKTIKSELLDDPGILQRFKKEADCWVQCGAHPNIVRAYFLDKVDDAFYITLEYIESDVGGPSLAEKLGSKIEDRKLLMWFINVADGLRHAYTTGIRAHRDVKPANILITTDNIAKISDFGLVGTPSIQRKALSHSDRGTMLYTAPGTVCGTPFYMAPEQFKDLRLCDQRSDVYSLGVTFYQVAALGKLPFGTAQRFFEEPRAPQKFWRDIQRMHDAEEPLAISSPLWPVLEKCLAKKPSDRFPDMTSLRTALEKIAIQLGVTVSAPLLPEEDFWSLGDRGVTLLRLGKYDEALDIFERCLSIFTWEGKTIFNKAICLYELGKYRQALECYEQLIAHKYGDGNALINSCYCHLKLGDDLLAESVAERATEIHPNNHLAWVTLGYIRNHQSKIRQALQAYRRAEKLKPDDPTVHYNSGLANRKLGQLRPAAKSFERFLMVASPLDKRRTIASAEVRKIEAKLYGAKKQSL